MFIEKVVIENYRSIRGAEVSFGAFTTFLGRNGVGKSTALYALESFYNISTQFSELDYYNHHQLDTSIRIRVTYGSLRPDELNEFGGYVHGSKLIVTKVINQDGARYYGTVAQIPEFAELRKLGANDKRNGLKQIVEAGKLPKFPADIPRKSEDVDRLMAQYESENVELTKPIDRETQFFGPRNVGGGKLDKFTKFVLVPAVKDAASEMERRGAIVQLLDLIVIRSISSREDFKKFKSEFEAKAKQLYGKDNLPELAELGRMVTERLKRYSPGAELLVDFEELKPPPIPLPNAIVTLSEDNFKVPVSYSGHGLQRALILALLEELSLTQPKPVEQPESGAKKEAEPIRIPDLILAIEEPELYLHPARSRYLAKILRDLAGQKGDDKTAGTQVISVTHSPYFVEVAHFDDVRMCRKVPTDEEKEPRVTTFASFTRLQAAQHLAQISGRKPEEFTADSFVAHAAPVLNSIVNEGLFADIAVVVEGNSDVAALWATQQIMGKNWDELGVVVVPVGGKNSIDRAVVVFQGFGIPTYFMFDGDKSAGQSDKRNQLLMKLGKTAGEDYPVTTVTDRYAVFEENIETYLQLAVGKEFEGLREKCAAQCGHDKPGESLKNATVMTMFLEEAYQVGFKFDILKAVVDKVTAMAEGLHVARKK